MSVMDQQRKLCFFLMMMGLMPAGINSIRNPSASKFFAFEPVGEKQVQVMQELEMIRSLGEVADRDMHKWWEEFDQMMGSYKQKRNDSICTNPDMLKGLLSKIDNQVEKVQLFTVVQYSCKPAPI